MQLFIGADHGGFAAKTELIPWLRSQGYQVEDCGATQLDPDDDYPDIAIPLAEKVVQHPESRGILICRSAVGVTIAANKVRGIRAAALFDERSAEHAVSNDNVNIFTFSGDWQDLSQMKQILQKALDSHFTGGRHQRRLDKIAHYETLS